MSQTKSGQNLRWYFQGSAVGMGKVTMVKPSTTRGLDPVKEGGNDDIVEYVAKITETDLSMGYNVINKKQLALAMGQPLSGAGGTTGEVPEIPDNFDCVERRIKSGTANTYVNGISAEVVEGYTLYQLCQWSKDDYDQEVDKIVSRSLSVKCRRPVNFEGNNGFAFDRFTGNGVLTSFVLSKLAIFGIKGNLTTRAEAPYQNYLKEFVDYTASNSASTTTVVFAVAPASSTVPNILVVYPW